VPFLVTGNSFKKAEEGKASEEIMKPVNYPVGKPLEV
jgi:hypothetical protein